MNECGETIFDIVYHRYYLFENYGEVFMYLFCCQVFSVEKTMKNRNDFNFLFHKTHKAFLTSLHGWNPSAQTNHRRCCSLMKESMFFKISSAVFLASGRQNKNCSTKLFE